ncbi:Golgi-associated plant pathogenesis-related protein 1 [Pseudolycoriella hygida]|uniref:Golgi-associated plant pathogenesis-related protein 1 n=1 Tax=Pseudolycoriella hygida TaxID=35572 RepID=A0A9Q0MXI0_9DIPT|nr:Golgi-associated plant pathogenesis-related protein 1 [Pseudolycoriella hygida]
MVPYHDYQGTNSQGLFLGCVTTDEEAILNDLSDGLDDDEGCIALNSLAVKCAQYYTGIRKIDHSCPYKKDAGENLAYSSWDQERNQFAGFCTKMWYDEGKTYNYNNPGFSPTTGHFTQLVWVNSQRFGFGYAHVNDYTVGVGLYRPSGNFRGEYEKNVLRP